MLGSRQADGPDVVWEDDRCVQLHQGDVIVKSVGVVVWVRYDLLQVPFHHIVSNLLLNVKAKVGFPRARLWESDDTQINSEQFNSFSASENHNTRHDINIILENN